MREAEWLNNMTGRLLSGRRRDLASASLRVGIRHVVDMARAGALWGLGKAGRIAGVAAMPAALWCFGRAMDLLPTDDVSDLLGSSLAFTLPWGGHVAVSWIPAVVTWPLQLGYAWAIELLEQPNNRPALLAYLGTCAGLLVVANAANWTCQTANNRAAKVAILVWIGALVANAIDIWLVATRPDAWDGVIAVLDIPNGGAVRGAEIILSLVLLSFWSVLHGNRVAPHVVGAFAKIMAPVRRRLTWSGAAAIVALPFIDRTAPALLSGLISARSTVDLVVAVFKIGAFAIACWALFVSGFVTSLGLLIRCGWQVLNTRPLIRKPGAPPGGPDRR